MVGTLASAFLYAVGYTAESRKFTLGYSTLGPAGPGLWRAKEIGAFEKYRLQTELVFRRTLFPRRLSLQRFVDYFVRALEISEFRIIDGHKLVARLGPVRLDGWIYRNIVP